MHEETNKEEPIFSFHIYPSDLREYETTDDEGNFAQPFKNFTDEQCKEVGQYIEMNISYAWQGEAYELAEEHARTFMRSD